jgi:hypothetical protein
MYTHYRQNRQSTHTADASMSSTSRLTAPLVGQSRSRPTSAAGLPFQPAWLGLGLGLGVGLRLGSGL